MGNVLGGKCPRGETPGGEMSGGEMPRGEKACHRPRSTFVCRFLNKIIHSTLNLQ